MHNFNAYNLYKNQDLETSKPDEIVGKLYGAASVSLKKSIIEINMRRLDKANENILKAETIVKVLDDTLDMQYPISEQLHTLYVYLMKRIREANVKKDRDILGESADMLSELRDTWNEAMRSYKMSSVKETG